MKPGLLAVVLAVACAGCVKPTPGPTPPPVDAADALPPNPLLIDASGDCAAACATLARLGCQGPGDCAATLQKGQDDRIWRDKVTGLAVTCAQVAAWNSKADVATHTHWSCTP